MENADITSKESGISKGSSAEGEDSAEKARNFINIATGVAGTVAAFLAGFGILPNASLSEQLLNFFAAIGLSGAIIAGIGAWRSIRRFAVMWTFIAMAFVCLAALAIVAARTTNPQPAIGESRTPYVPASSANSPPVASPNGTSAIPSVGHSANSRSSENSPTGSSGYTEEFAGREFKIPGDGCPLNSYYPHVLFTAQEPHSVPNDYNSNLDGPDGSYDMTLQCYDGGGQSHDPGQGGEIDFQGPSALFLGKPNPEACEKQITSNPLPADTYPTAGSTGGYVAFSQLIRGAQFCLLGVEGNNLVYVKLLTVSNTTYTTTWVATAWTIPANS